VNFVDHGQERTISFEEPTTQESHKKKKKEKNHDKSFFKKKKADSKKSRRMRSGWETRGIETFINLLSFFFFVIL
jgi:hypothetical protein